MKKTSIDKLKLDVFEEILDNGLRVIIVPMKCNNIYATLSTKYGSNNNDFVPINEKKMKCFPYGIAHFLEHKLFEMEDGSDPFEFYSNNGADCNANTSNYKTTYLFSGPTNFKENVNYLFDFVFNPYFTDRNVSKEKGIIIQEIKMYLDDPINVLYEKSLYNSFINHPMKIPVIGDINNVNMITKEDLYCCYNTFYNPSNMFFVVTGNVDPLETVEIIKNNFSDKKFDLLRDIKCKKYDEPDKVFKKYESIDMNVNLPKIAVNYKFNISSFDFREFLSYMSLIIDINFGATSLLNENLKNDKVITSNIDFTFIYTDTHILLMIFGETENIERFTSSINNQISNLVISKDEFDRKKINCSSSYVFMSDNIFNMNEKFMDDIIKYDNVIFDDIEYIKSLEYDRALEIIKEIDFSNKNVVVVENKKDR